MARTAVTQPATPQESFQHKLSGTLNERLALSGLAYSVPEHANSLPYILGGISLFGFVILIASGVLLAQFYHPHPSSAHNSVIYIMTQVPFGDIIRSIHYWAANLVTLLVLIHMLRVFFTASYKRPREINWLAGLGLLAVTLGFVFTGSVLKWDQEGVEALGHNQEIGEILGSLGVWFTGEFSRTVPILTRLYVGHVTLLPALFVVLMAVHFYLIKQLGISRKATADATSGPTSATSGESVTSRFTVHLQKMVGYGLLLFSFIIILSLFFPAPLGKAGIAGAEVTKPPWMFLPIYPLEDLLGITGLLIGGATLFILLAAVPFVDRSPWLSPRRRKWVIAVGMIILMALIILGGYAWLSRPAVHLIQ
ncbi:MAG: cytochrome bc complex cytochrome b subunit [Chloroflexi bacterium]|nr:cytochrome bc complex cytochrome b subunit [Chloroflexota bacterium]